MSYDSYLLSYYPTHDLPVFETQYPVSHRSPCGIWTDGDNISVSSTHRQRNWIVMNGNVHVSVPYVVNWKAWDLSLAKPPPYKQSLVSVIFELSTLAYFAMAYPKRRSLSTAILPHATLTVGV